jgi:zona occludens toxin (predicted ATPase)
MLLQVDFIIGDCLVFKLIKYNNLDPNYSSQSAARKFQFLVAKQNHIHIIWDFFSLIQQPDISQIKKNWKCAVLSRFFKLLRRAVERNRTLFLSTA